MVIIYNHSINKIPLRRISEFYTSFYVLELFIFYTVLTSLLDTVLIRSDL